MDMVTAVNLKKYYITDTYEVRALDGRGRGIPRGGRDFGQR